MKSNLIKDTTKEERIALIKAWIPDDDGLQDCDMDLWDIYADYINGKREIAEINPQMTGTFYTEEDLNHRENADTIRYTKSLHGDDRIMQYTPRDILNYVYEKELDTQFLLATANHVQDFSIGEITDKKIEKRGEDFYLVSKSYHLDIKITDDEVLTAAINGLYISAFISRKDDNYRVHFLVHQYPDQMKARFEEKITKDVVDYMIYGTIMALRLDTPEKVNAYLGI